VRGQFAEAIPLAERMFALCRDRKVGLVSPTVADMLGYVYVLSGSMANGLELLRQAVELYTSQGRLAAQPNTLVHLGEALLRADRREDAALSAGQALTLARERGQHGYEAYALRLVAEIASHREPPVVDQAADHYGQALALATELGRRWPRASALASALFVPPELARPDCIFRLTGFFGPSRRPPPGCLRSVFCGAESGRRCAVAREGVENDSRLGIG
jgi:tetratricopeptide (TPR) repeat protein